MNALDLFSGIGGFSLGLERAGMRTVAFCERDEFCRAVLRKHWPSVPCFDDVRAIDADGLDRLGRIDLVCGGFPCQPFSVAGRQAAQDDDRYLWPAMREVIALARPTWAIGENVTGIIALALDDVLADLEGLGYASRAFVIPAVAVDARHRRDRVWIIARDAHDEGESALPVDAEVAELRRAATYTDQQQLREQPGRGRRENGADALLAAEHGTHGDVAHSSGVGFARISGGREEGAPQCRRWPPEPDVDRVANGVPNRMDRLRCLGNAVVPQVVEEIGRAIMRVSA